MDQEDDPDLNGSKKILSLPYKNLIVTIENDKARKQINENNGAIKRRSGHNRDRDYRNHEWR